MSRHLHELDSCTVGISNVDNALARVRTGFESLRFAADFPAGRRDFLQNPIEVIDSKSDVNRSNIARPNIDMLFSIGRREILEQFDFVSAGRFHNREFDLSAGNARNLTRHFVRLVHAMRKFKTENILPEVERALEIRDRNAGVIRGDDSK